MHTVAKSFVRALLLSIDSVPVAAPAPARIPPPPDDGLLARARENAGSIGDGAQIVQSFLGR